MQDSAIAAQNERIFQVLIPMLQAELGADLLGVLAAGSRIHGNPGPTSDLDVHVVVARPARRRHILLLEGVEVELLFNPVFQIMQYLAIDPVDRSLFTHGRILYDPQGVVAELSAKARVLWEQGPDPVGPFEVWRHRYLPADQLRDLEDVALDDSATQLLLLTQITDRLLDTHYRLHRRWRPKAKRCLADLEKWDASAAQLARTVLSCAPFVERRAALVQLAEHVLAPLGGLMPREWQIEWEPLTP